MQTWTGFYTVTAAAAATLLGLLFVAVSMHATAIMGEGHEASKRMAEQAFQNYLAVILVSLLALFPQLQLRSFGLIALALTAVGDVWVLVRLIQALTRPHDREDWLPSLRRHFASLIGYALLFYAALRMSLGDSDSRNAFAVAVMVLVSSATVMSWELLIGLAKARLSPQDRHTASIE
jgi:hypothetical protein